MNSYNDNLHTVVVNSLFTQELDQKQLKSQKVASMFTLYHAEGATITAEEKLQSDTILLGQKNAVYAQAVDNSNIAINLLSSATQASTYLKQSVTNTSVAAANVQVAGTAILKLASDLGSIFSIVNAADYDTDIYALSEEARKLINHTAYLAEVTSQKAMEASINTSEVSGSIVLSKAKNANGLMSNLLQVVTTDFNNVSQLVANDTANVAATSVVEKAAEGDYEDIVADYAAAANAYTTMNNELNLGLSVNPAIITQTSDIPLTAQQKAENVTKRNIVFNAIVSPFNIKNAPDNYPVQQYNIIVVPNQKKTVFSITDAENIMLQYPQRFIPLMVAAPVEGSESVITDGLNAANVVSFSSGQISLEVDFFNIDGDGTVLQDSDGKNVTLGKGYVVFVMAIYAPNYKKKLNNFDDFISAASPRFSLRNPLVQATKVTVGMNTAASNTTAKTATKAGK